MRNWEKDIEEMPWWKYLKKAGYTEAPKHFIRFLLQAQEAKTREECAEIVDGMECYTQGVYDNEEIEKTKQKILNPNENFNE